ncbi:MAG: 16S rRNA (guanine(966)-N(2))-methyltransferase RsmD [Anaerolineae bacterium]|nr:16S rRNA (guanine(966)-N(2))-methyltransferase RsmD [Thermoflexales bacterium]MDW8394725.1 16S rRNA (guanine(966)-N(2))-methyltransferase RsmD [Anaerolineae bacterium]
MRINSGIARGRHLKSVPNESTRPVTDRVKQAVFNILAGDVLDSRWLDLFAGTGAVGIEALSRGARAATFVDIEPAAIRTIKENLQITGLADRAIVIRSDAFEFIRAKPNTSFDFIYVAPPQYQGLWVRALAAIDENVGWLDPDGAVIVQLDPQEFAPMPLINLELVDQRRYGKTMLLFYERSS